MPLRQRLLHLCSALGKLGNISCIISELWPASLMRSGLRTAYSFSCPAFSVHCDSEDC